MGVVVVLAIGLAFVQFGSDGVFSSAAARFSVPARVSPALGESVYRIIASVAPAPYANDMLARSALELGDPAAAKRYAQTLPISTRRSDLLARIDQAAGNQEQAQREFLRADDVFALDGRVAQLANRNPAAAYALEMQIKERLAQTGTHPDALAQAYWRLGVLQAQQQRPAAAMNDYRAALALSPISSRYLLFTGFEAYDLRLFREAQIDFQRAIGVDPRDADAYAGAGMAALAQGDRTSALAYAARARALDPRGHALRTLQAKLHS